MRVIGWQSFGIESVMAVECAPSGSSSAITKEVLRDGSKISFGALHGWRCVSQQPGHARKGIMHQVRSILPIRPTGKEARQSCRLILVELFQSISWRRGYAISRRQRVALVEQSDEDFIGQWSQSHQPAVPVGSNPGWVASLVRL